MMVKVYKTKKNGNKIELCQWVDNVGYKQVKSTDDKQAIYLRVHRLVAETFIPNPQIYRKLIIKMEIN